MFNKLSAVGKALKYLLAALGFLFVLPTAMFGGVGSGLDPSWQIALNLAYEKGLIFGRDFLFTYGPLGFLSTRLPFESTKPLIFLNDILFFAGVGYCFFQAAARCKRVWGGIVILLIAVGSGGLIYFMDLSISLYLLVIFYAFLYLEQRKVRFLLMAAPFGVIAFFVKLNLGIAAIGTVIFFTILDAVRSRRLLRAVSVLAVPAVLLAVSAILLPVDLPLYFKGSLQITSGYNESMFIAPTSYYTQLYQALSILGALALCLLLYIRSITRSLDSALRCVWISFFLFLLFKQSFVRADAHVFVFLQYCTAAIGILYLFSEPKLRFALTAPLILSLALSLWQLEKVFFTDRIPERLSGVGRYLSAMLSPSERAAASMPRWPSALPQSFTDKIGTQPVDIIPWEIRTLYDAGLNYLPRPVMQSYSAYTEYLDGMNAEKYRSADGPRFVVFSNGCIDNRYCFFDETQTKTALLTHFKPVDRAGESLLLERRAAPAAVSLTEAKSGRLGIGQRLRFSSANRLLLMKVSVRYSFLGWLRLVLYQPAELDVIFRFEDGSSQTFRALPALLKGGVLINKFASSIEDAEAFFAGAAEKMRPVRSVEFISRDGWAFNPRMQYQLFELSAAGIPASPSSSPESPRRNEPE